MKCELIKIERLKTEKEEIVRKLDHYVNEDTQCVLLAPFIKDSESLSIDFTLHFEKAGVKAEIIALFKTTPGSRIALSTTAHHKAPNTECETKVKGVLQDRSSSTYHGMIKIDKSAQQTSSFLHDSVLVIGKDTVNRSDPVLEIEANDVKASHGATAGKIDQMTLFYLQSRDLTLEECQSVVVEGFFESLISTIKSEDIRKKATSLLLGKHK